MMNSSFAGALLAAPLRGAKGEKMEELLVTRVLREDHQKILLHIEQLKSSIAAFNRNRLETETLPSEEKGEKGGGVMQLAQQLADLADDVQRMQVMLKFQNEKEEEVFYPALRKLYFQSGSIKKPWLDLSLLLQEHWEMIRRAKTFRQRVQPQQSVQDNIPLEIKIDELEYGINVLKQLIGTHFNKEDNILSPLVDLSLSDWQKRELAARLQNWDSL